MREDTLPHGISDTNCLKIGLVRESLPVRNSSKRASANGQPEHLKSHLRLRMCSIVPDFIRRLRPEMRSQMRYTGTDRSECVWVLG